MDEPPPLTAEQHEQLCEAYLLACAEGGDIAADTRAQLSGSTLQRLEEWSRYLDHRLNDPAARVIRP